MRRFRVPIKEGDMAGIAFGDPVKPFEVLFLHANGFNAITYQSILEPLGSQAHCAAVDMRGHGRTQLPALPGALKSWNRFRDDVIQLIEATSPEGVVLSGHSMGATVALLVAGRRPELVRGLVLAEPVLLARSYYRWANLPLVGGLRPRFGLAKQALKRRRDFEGPGEAIDSLRGKGAFRTWRSPFLEDFVIDGVLRRDTGRFGLSCAPEWEAACFDAQRNRPWTAIGKLRKRRQIPIIVLQAERDSTAPNDVDTRIHAVRPDAAVTRVPGTTHFLPMERPYVVRDAIRLLFEATSEGSEPMDYVGAVRRTINSSIGVMN